MNIGRLFAPILFSVCAFAQVEITQKPNQVVVTIDGHPASTFFYGPEITKPYLYPLRTAKGVELTRHWPMEDKPGDPHDHIHHRGVWFAHANVNDFDFWNSDPSYHKSNMGRIVVAKIDAVKSGAKQGSIQATMQWLEPSGKELIEESRVMTFYNGDPRIVDFDITVTAKEKAAFNDEKDGVFGLRRAAELDEDHGAQMTAANGCHQEAGCWGKRAGWLDVSGKIDGGEAGVTVFDHPDNPRGPTYWHARGYGLLAANIFGVKSFTHDPKADGVLTLAPGQSMRFRYRIVLHEGDAGAAKIETLYKEWASGKQ